MYGTLEDASGNTRPLLSGQQQLHNRSSKNQQLFSQGLETGRRALPSRGSVARPVLTEILVKPHLREVKGNARESSVLGLANTNENQPTRNKKSFVYTMLNPRSTAWQAVAFKWFITIVITMDLLSFVISTEPDLTEAQKKQCYVWEGITSTIFLAEYVARLVVITEARKYSDLGMFLGRFRYATTFSALLDFAATFPFFLELFTGWDLPTLTYLRAFRLLRILKTSGFAEATNAVYRVVYYNRQILYVALLICIGLVLITSVLMYYLRPKDPDHSQEFKSLASTMYLSTLMLTGQGGPEGDMPWYTKSVVLLTGIFSIGMFAIPASMLTWGFEAEAERCAKLNYALSAKRAAAETTENDNWSFSSDDYSTDEEYRRIIAGDDESDEESVEEAKQTFMLADVDSSGNISLTEFLSLSRERDEKASKIATHKSEELSFRLVRLEMIVEQNSKKLDRVCQLLEALQQK